LTEAQVEPFFALQFTAQPAAPPFRPQAKCVFFALGKGKCPREKNIYDDKGRRERKLLCVMRLKGTHCRLSLLICLPGSGEGLFLATLRGRARSGCRLCPWQIW